MWSAAVPLVRSTGGRIHAFVSVHAGPILATADEPAEHATFDPQALRIVQGDIGSVGLAILRVVGPALPSIALGRLHVEQDRHADDGAIAQLRIGILAIRLVPILRAGDDAAQIVPAFLDADVCLAVFDQPLADRARLRCVDGGNCRLR